MSSTPTNSTFQYNSLDPATPVAIEEYSELYDDYLDSPDSQSAATMNSGAAIYEQSVEPSYEDLNNVLPSYLNNRNQSYISDESLDSSFAENTELQLKTPNFLMNTRFDSPRTPTARIETPVLNSRFENDTIDPRLSLTNDSIAPSPNIQSSKFSSRSNPLGIYNVPPPIPHAKIVTSAKNNHLYSNSSLDNTSGSNMNSSVYSLDSKINESNFESSNGTYYNDSTKYSQNNETMDDERDLYDDQDDDDDDDDYDDAEVEQLRLQAKIKNQQVYASYNDTSDIRDSSINNDATVIIKTPGKPIKVTKKGIKDFKLSKELGEGSYSTVMLGTDLQTGVKYAIKILNKRHIIKEKKVKYVNIEKTALNRLGKRMGIVGLHYTFQDSQSLYFVLDFAENGELLTLIKKYGTMNDSSTKYYSVQLIDAIDYMHKNGVVHRDLKPENILIDKNMKLQVTDYGTAKLLDKDDSGNYPSDTRANSFVGTAEYVSPELLNDKYCGKAADVWALGCIIYQMIAGKPPFKATNEYLTFQKIQKLQYAFTAGFPIIIRDLIKRILIIKPRERLTIFDIKRHLWFQDINWQSEDQIWNSSPPELGPYKISAKAMKPMPELEAQYPNGSSTSVNQLKKSRSANLLATSSAATLKKGSMSKQRSVSANTVPTSAPASTPTPAHNSASQVSAKASRSMQSQPKKKKSASNAAAFALYGNSRKSSSSGPTAHPQTPKSKSSTKKSPSPNNIQQQQQQVAQTTLYQPQPSTTDIKQLAADKIIKARQQQNKENKVHVSRTTTSSTVDVIPGTNIPRPVLNTKISSRTNTGTNSRHNSSLKTNKKTEVPQLSTLDLKWVQFLKHHDERIMKVGVVDASRELTSSFDKKYKGLMAESPLGYRNKDNINQPSIFSNEDEESILLLDIPATLSEIVGTYEPDGETDPEYETSVTKFRKFFTVKQPTATLLDTKYVVRTMIITTFGRALLFHENYGDKKVKYELTTEIDLTNSLVHFVEIVTDRRGKANKGLFAIMSNSLTICLETDKAEISQWTQCLFNSRIMEKERRLKEHMNSSSGDTALIEGEATAFAAANLAATKSPDLGTPINFVPKSTKSLFPSTLRDPSDEPQNSAPPAPMNTPPPLPGRKKFPASSLSSKGNTTNISVLQGKHDTIGKGPMISAAVNKAVSMATPNAAVGVRESAKSDSNKITQMNSKFLARSRRK